MVKEKTIQNVGIGVQILYSLKQRKIHFFLNVS